MEGNIPFVISAKFQVGINCKVPTWKWLKPLFLNNELGELPRSSYLFNLIFWLPSSLSASGKLGGSNAPSQKQKVCSAPVETKGNSRPPVFNRETLTTHADRDYDMMPRIISDSVTNHQQLFELFSCLSNYSINFTPVIQCQAITHDEEAKTSHVSTSHILSHLITWKTNNDQTVLLL